MAVISEIRIRTATRQDHDAIEQQAIETIQATGGWPSEIMAHLVRADGDGLVVIQAWRTESAMRHFHQAVIAPAIAEAGLEADELMIRPLWGFATQ